MKSLADMDHSERQPIDTDVYFSSELSLSSLWHVISYFDEERLFSQDGEVLSVKKSDDPVGYHIVRTLKNDTASAAPYIATAVAQGFDDVALRKTLTRLRSQGVVQVISSQKRSSLSNAVEERFQRQLEYFLPFESEFTSRYDMLTALLGSTVSIIGMGAQGAQIASLLCACGVGTLRLIDGDKVELSNLPRMPTLSESDVGTPKVTAVANKLIAHRPCVQVESICRFIGSQGDAVHLLEGSDLIILCADQPRLAIVRWIGDASLALNSPFIAMAGAWVGPISIPRHSPCHACQSRFFASTISDVEGYLRANLDSPLPARAAFGPGPATRAAFIADHAVRYLSGISTPLVSERFKVDWTGIATRQKLVRYVDCPKCS